jgi:RNA polymerase sigma-70 factor (family 1)
MQASPPYDDKLLFQQIAEGDENAFREIFNRYTPQIHPFVFGIVKNEMVAKEIVQEVFLRIWLKRETLTSIEKPSSWIYRIASNLSLTHFRRQKLEEKIIQGMGSEDIHEPDEAFNAKELQGLINEAASKLPPKRQRIFRMSREEGLSRKEIAARLAISENTVKAQIMISLKFVQEFIQKTTGIYIPLFFLIHILRYC